MPAFRTMLGCAALLAAARALGAADGGFEWFAVSDLATVFEDGYRPPPRLPEIKVFGVRGETVSAQAVLAARETLDKVEVAPGMLAQEGGGRRVRAHGRDRPEAEQRDGAGEVGGRREDRNAVFPGGGMRRGAALALLPLLAAAQELATETIEAGGMTRTYRHYSPAKGRGKLPLVFVLHGAGGDGARVAASSRFERLAAEKGFIAVFPDGFERHWNDLRGIPEWTAQQRNIDDVAFFSAVIDRFVQSRGADPKRVFVTGISNGGLMCHRLGCELAGKVAAIAPVVRTLTVKLAETCAPARPMPTLMFFGTADKLVPFEGGLQKMGSIETPVLSARQTAVKWAALNGCGAKPATTRTAEPPGRIETYSGCRGGAEVISHIREGAGHSWPKDATGLIWAFFEQHPMR